MERSIELSHGLQDGDIDISLYYLQSIVKRGLIQPKPCSLQRHGTAGLIERGRNEFLKGLSIALPISILMWTFIILGFKRLF